MGSPSIVAAFDGDPWSPATWSGSSHRLMAALDRRGVLAGTVNTRPRWLDMAEKAASFSPDGVRWRQRYRAASSPVSPLVKRAMSEIGARRVHAVDPEPDALLQISGWYDARGRDRVEPRLFCTYQDANIALWLRRPDIAVDPSSHWISRTHAYERRVYDRMDLIMTMTDWARRSFIEDYGQDPDKVVTVGAGANFDALPLPPFPRQFTQPRLLFLGRKFERKGGAELLTAFAALRSTYPQAELTVVGPPPREDADGVRWLGPIFRDTPEGADRLDALFRDATAFVMPSLYEGFGIPFLEAMAYELPCVGSSACAIPEIVEDGRTGLTPTAGDAHALADALHALAGDPARAEEMGRLGRRRFLEGFTWDRTAERIATAIASRLDPIQVPLASSP